MSADPAHRGTFVSISEYVSKITTQSKNVQVSYMMKKSRILPTLIILCAFVSFIIIACPRRVERFFQETQRLRGVVINLKRNESRLKSFVDEYEINEVSYKVFNAVDGVALNKSFLIENNLLSPSVEASLAKTRAGELCDHWEVKTMGAVGCFLSHFLVWQMAFQENPSREIVVFEDDCVAKKVNDLSYRLSDLPDDWHMYLFGFPHTVYDDAPHPKKSNLRIVKKFCGLHAYVVSPAGLKKLLDSKSFLFPIHRQVDWVLSDMIQDLNFKVYVHDNKTLLTTRYLSSDVQA